MNKPFTVVTKEFCVLILYFDILWYLQHSFFFKVEVWFSKNNIFSSIFSVFSQKKGGHIASHWYSMLGTIKQVLPCGLPIMCNFCSLSLQRSPRKGHNVSCFLYFYSYIQLSSTFINDIFFPIFSQKSCVFPPKCLSPRSAHNPSAAGPREVLWGVWQPPEPAHWVLVPLPVLQSLAGRPARLDVCHFYHRCVFCLCLSCQRFV